MASSIAKVKVKPNAEVFTSYVDQEKELRDAMAKSGDRREYRAVKRAL